MNKNKKPLVKSDLTQNIGRLCLSAGLIFSPLAVGAQTPTESQTDTRTDITNSRDTASTTLTLGTPASFLSKLQIRESRHSVAVPSAFTLVNHLGEEINVVADNFSVENDGTLSMNGHAQDIENVEFILQGDDENVYGWIILKDQDVAYEYTTQNGNLVVNEIAITDVHPICDFENHDISSLVPQAQQIRLTTLANEPHIGSYQGQDVSKLESKPGSSYVVLLDTSNIMNGSTPTDRSAENLWTTWQIVAASFSMFDVNVTTSTNIYNQAVPSRRGGGTLYTQGGRSSCAFAFGTSTFCTLYKEADAYGQGRIAAHELGHLFHLNHDGGSPGGEYHQGFADYQWVPVMGNIWYGNAWTHALYQWSKGEYSGASNREDDFTILTRYIPFKPDDNANSTPLVVEANGNVSASNNGGQIERNTDTDLFTFTVGSAGGHANLSIDRTEHIGGGMLDVQATIKNSAGSVVAQSNKSANRAASFNTSLAAGSYTLEIAGGAEGTPSRGFSKYSSLGYYGIAGSVTGTDGGTDPVVPGTPVNLQSSNITNDSVTVSWAAVEGASVYGLQRSTDSANTWVDAGSSTSTSKNITGLTAKDQWVRVKATNSAGSSDYSSDLYVELLDVVTPPVTVLQNDVPVSGLSASTGVNKYYTLDVPVDATNVSFTTSGGSGDADLFIKFGSTASDSVYDCKSDNSNSTESCAGTQSGGTYYVLVKAYSTYSGVTLTGSYSVDDPTKNVAPVVAVTNPNSGDKLSVGDNVTFAANATDSDGTVVKVDFVLNGQLLASTTSAPYSYSWNADTAGSYTLVVTATDDDGATGSSTVNFTVGADIPGECNAPAWSASTVYNGGDRTSVNGQVYQAHWWTQGQNPTAGTDPWYVWRIPAECL
ncbi:MAG: pre-peptidase C-terminal domain-containing protein [Algicola sp.]|nr:pre-peptidase C-terminal domain-containing protein [Algicola sp.]